MAQRVNIFLLTATFFSVTVLCMAKNTSKRRLVALTEEGEALLMRLSRKIERDTVIPVKPGQVIWLALRALAKQEGLK